jgi:hypothetical protein
MATPFVCERGGIGDRSLAHPGQERCKGNEKVNHEQRSITPHWMKTPLRWIAHHKNELISLFRWSAVNNSFKKGRIGGSLTVEKALARAGLPPFIARSAYTETVNRLEAIFPSRQLFFSFFDGTLGALMEAVGLNLNPVQLNWAAQERHNVGGNGMRRGATSDLKLDDKWRHELRLSQKLVRERINEQISQ